MSGSWDLRRVRYFLAVTETGSFTRAAAQLSLAQPSLSTQIRMFEEDLAVVLLDRSSRTVRLTEAGALIADEARVLLKDLAAVVSDLQRQHPACVRGPLRTDDLHLRLLRQLVGVAHHGGYRRAAAHSDLSPSGLAAAVERLERHLGLQLVHRGARQVALTSAGGALVPEARRLLLVAARANARAASIQQGTTGRVHLGYIHGARTSVLPRLARALADRAPGITLVGTDGWPSRLLRDLVDGDLDLVLTRYPEPHPALAHETIHQEPLLLALPVNHRLAVQRELTLADIHGQTLVLWPRESARLYFDEVLRRCQAAGVRPLVREDHLTANADMGLVTSGHALALTTPTKARALPPGVVARRLHDQAPLPLDAVWRRIDVSPAVSTVLHILRASASIPHPDEHQEP